MRSRTELDDVQREVAKAESDVQLVRDRAARDQARLDAGTGSAKDLQAIQHELTSLARRQSELEDIELEVMERAEAAESDVAELERGRGELTARITALEAARDEAFARLDGEAADIGAPRPTVVDEVGADLVALYEKIRAANGGTGAAAAAPAPLRRVPARAQPGRDPADPLGTRGRGAALRGVPPHPRAHRRVRAVSRRLTVEADGGSRGNPGVAGYGALVRDTDTGALLAERAEPLGKQSNNVAEYRGLIAGLEAALAIDPAAEVHARMDSKLVVEQMSGRWKIKHEDMRRLALQARDLVSGFTRAGGSVRFSGSRGPRTRTPTRLSNVAMDGRVVDRTFGGPSEVDDVPGEPASDDQPRRTGFDRRGTPTRVVLVRHGVTDFTAQGRLDGRGGPDPRLNATGRAQAVAAGRAVASLVQGHPTRVVTSSLSRAMETGAAVAAAVGVDPVVDAEWDEQSFGDWDGRSIEELVDGRARRHAGAARRRGLPAAGRRVARRPRRAGRARLGAGGRRGRHQRRRLPPQADPRRAGAPARAAARPRLAARRGPGLADRRRGVGRRRGLGRLHQPHLRRRAPETRPATASGRDLRSAHDLRR